MNYRRKLDPRIKYHAKETNSKAITQNNYF